MIINAVSHYSYTVNRAGGEIYLKHLLEALAKGNDVTACFTMSGENEVVNDVKLLRTTDIIPADVHITQFANAPRVIKYAHANETPVVLIAHNDKNETLEHAKTLLPCDLLICNTEWIANKIVTRAKKIVLRPIVKNFERNQTDDYITIVNPALAKGSNVFYNMALRYPERKFLAVQGGYWQEQQQLLNFANVNIQPQTDDMQSVYDKTSIVLMMSTYESFGMVAREAALQGIPVIATRTEGLIENLGEDYEYFAGYEDYDTVAGYIEALDDAKTYSKAASGIKKRAMGINSDKELKAAVGDIMELKWQG